MTAQEIRNKIEDVKSVSETIPIEIIDDILAMHYGDGISLEAVAADLNDLDTLWVYLSNGQRISMKTMDALLSDIYQRKVCMEIGMMRGND